MVIWTRVVHHRSLWLVLGSILVIAGSATASSVVLSQTLGATNPTPVLINNCAGYALVEETPYVPGTTTNLTYDCGQGVPAFEVGPFPPSIHYVYATPTFALPSMLTALYVVIPGSAGTGHGVDSCTSYYGTAYPLTSGMAVEFQGGGPALSWDYCAVVLSGATSVSAFQVTWVIP
jgi:hypothetical protein